MVTILVAVTILLWASGRLPEYLTALIFFAAAMMFSVAPASVIFSGFVSAAFWLVLSGYVIGLALATALGTFQLSASVLPANVPNLVMLGAVETSYGLHLSYFPYLLANLPVLGLLKGPCSGCVFFLCSVTG
ncbi:hypothetical protein RPE78_00410 [Thioclava litoralis]|uniref:Uncharacterized protein n=1 Tax=Thioclava litoralis TaxID=3076557 RepID=A0ABZ1DZZ4_9RHOB|nr:hypothetical protein RPE78_00410 [Thioclava sp. FTW29]